jgi:hypothetical protein
MASTCFVAYARVFCMHAQTVVYIRSATWTGIQGLKHEFHTTDTRLLSVYMYVKLVYIHARQIELMAICSQS